MSKPRIKLVAHPKNRLPGIMEMDIEFPNGNVMWLAVDSWRKVAFYIDLALRTGDMSGGLDWGRRR